MHHTRPSLAGAKISPIRARILVSAFDFDYTYGSYPVLCGHAAIGHASPITVVKPYRALSEDYVFAVRWSDGTYAFRYLLWNIDNNLLAWPEYAGEIIPVGAYLEVWAHDAAGDNIAGAASELETSILGEISASAPCCGDQGVIDYSITFTAPPVLPADLSCNPFCEPLC